MHGELCTVPTEPNEKPFLYAVSIIFLWPRIREILLPEGTCILEEICQFPVLVRASAVTPPASGTDSLHPPVASSLVPPF